MNPTHERWLPVPGFEGYYEVSDHGSVRSLDRQVTPRNGSPYNLSGKVLSLSENADGYPMVQLWRDGRGTRKLVHALVLEAFVGPRPEEMEACHWDDNRTDNRVQNLRWGTQSENRQDRIRNGRDHEKRKTHCPRGHALIGGNLVPSELRKGKRACRACNSCWKVRTKYGISSPEFREAADRAYARRMASL